MLYFYFVLQKFGAVPYFASCDANLQQPRDVAVKNMYAARNRTARMKLVPRTLLSPGRRRWNLDRQRQRSWPIVRPWLNPDLAA